MWLEPVSLVVFLREGESAQHGTAFRTLPVQIDPFEDLRVRYRISAGCAFVEFHFNLVALFLDHDLPSVDVKCCILRCTFILCHAAHWSYHEP